MLRRGLRSRPTYIVFFSLFAVLFALLSTPLSPSAASTVDPLDSGSVFISSPVDGATYAAFSADVIADFGYSGSDAGVQCFGQEAYIANDGVDVFNLPGGANSGDPISTFVPLESATTGVPIPPGDPVTFSVTCYEGADQDTIASAEVSFNVAAPPPPIVTLTVPADGITYTQGQSVAPVYACNGSVPGELLEPLGTCSATGTVDTMDLGTHTYTVTGEDWIGQQTVVSHSYTVVPVATAPSFTSPDSTQFVENVNNPFQIDASGAPSPTLTASDDLPPGVSFTDNGNGTATLSGAPDPGSSGEYDVTITATNNAGSATQVLAIVVSAVPTAPAIVSDDSAEFEENLYDFVKVDATGDPTPSFTESGSLPSGLTFADNGDGTATISGTPDDGSNGEYDVTITADNNVAPAATQVLKIFVDSPPDITSDSSTTFTVGMEDSFEIDADGNPDPDISYSGTLPSGIMFKDNGDGTATLWGQAATGTEGDYTITISADNGIDPVAMQDFALTVATVPVISSPDDATFTEGQFTSFPITATGSPTPTISEADGSDPLPSGLSFVPGNPGTATLWGTPNPGTSGSYTIYIDADNGSDVTTEQELNLTVNAAPTISGPVIITVTENNYFSYNYDATGDPTPTLSETGLLPQGVDPFNDNGDGTGTLDGTPTQTGGYSITITASNGVSPPASINVILEVHSVPAPTVTAVTPNNGVQAGGNQVTLTGTGFSGGLTTVDFGANVGTSVNVSSGTSLTVVAPAGTGTVSVTVITTGGGASTPLANAYTYVGSGPGGAITLTKTTALVGNYSEKVSGTGWNADTSVTVDQCATTTYSASRCDTANQVSATIGTGTHAGIFSNAFVKLATGTIDSNNDTCGLSGSPNCYVVVTGNTGDATASAALGFTTPSFVVKKTTALVGNYADVVKATGIPIGDTVVAQECDAGVTVPATVSTNCDGATKISGTAGSTGVVIFSPTGVTMRVGSAYSDGASGTCAFGGTCAIVITDSNNALINDGVSVGFASPTLLLKKSTAALGNYVDGVKVSGIPVGDTVVAQECDAGVTVPATVSTNCDGATKISGTAGSTGVVIFSPTGVTLRVGSAYSDGASGTCAFGGTCDIAVTDSNNAAVGLSATVSFATPVVSIHKTTGVLGDYVDAIKAMGVPIGDTLFAQECDPTVVVPTSVGSNCDAATQISGTAGSTGAVLWGAAGVTMAVGGAYSDSAGRTCPPGGTCDLVVTDSNNSALTFEGAVTFATPTATS